MPKILAGRCCKDASVAVVMVSGPEKVTLELSSLAVTADPVLNATVLIAAKTFVIDKLYMYVKVFPDWLSVHVTLSVPPLTVVKFTPVGPTVFPLPGMGTGTSAALATNKGKANIAQITLKLMNLNNVFIEMPKLKKHLFLL